jgi:hypothetical protein
MPHGEYSIGLITSLFLHALVASVVSLNPNATLQGRLASDLQVAALVFGIMMLLTVVGISSGGGLQGRSERFVYLGLTVTLLFAVTFFPPSAAFAKPVLTNLTLLVALSCSGAIYRRLHE